MIAAAALYLLLCAGGVLAAVFPRASRFEDGAAAGGFLLMLLLFCFGLAGALRSGAAAALALGCGAYAAALIRLIKTRDFAGFARRMCTPAFAFFTALFLLAAVSDFGRLAANRDDLAHWADTVKIMWQTDAFADVPASHAQYQTYPPGMALIQYALMRINGAFDEWLLFMPPAAMTGLLLLPALRGLSWKSGWRIPLLFLAAAALPGVLFDSAYRTLMIDPYLACLSGYLLALAVRGAGGRLERLSFLSGMAALALVKQSGIGFAVMIAATAAIASLVRTKRARALLMPAFGFFSAALSALLWKLRTLLDGAAESFPGRIDWAELARILCGRADGGYRADTLRAFFRRAALSPLDTGALYLPLSFFAWLLLLALLAFLIVRSMRKRGIQTRGMGAGLLCGFACALLFAAGTALSYLYKFTEHEAAVLNCFDRYMSTPLVMLLFALFTLASAALPDRKEKAGRGLLAALLTLTLALCPYKELANLALRRNTAYSEEVRAPYAAVIGAVEALSLPEGAKTALVAEGARDFDLQMLRFTLRPLWLPEYETLEVGEADLSDAGVSAERWRAALLGEEYEYVVLLRLSDGFAARYQSCFADPAQIREGGIYRVNAEGLLSALSFA